MASINLTGNAGRNQYNTDEISWRRSERGSKVLTVNHFYYEVYSQATSHILWRYCTRNCPARIRSPINYDNTDSVLVTCRYHNHENDFIKNIRDDYYNKLKEKIKKSDDTPYKVIHDVLEGVEEDIVRIRGLFRRSYKYLNNVRERFVNPKPYIYPNLKLHNRLRRPSKINCLFIDMV